MGDEKKLTLVERLTSFFNKFTQKVPDIDATISSDALSVSHPLIDKIGFKIYGVLEDGRHIDYDIYNDYSGKSLAEIISVAGRRSERTLLFDYTHDGTVDKIWMGKNIPALRKIDDTIEFDPNYFTEEQAREMFASADDIFREVTSWPELLQKRDAYSCRIQGNPLSPPQ